MDTIKTKSLIEIAWGKSYVDDNGYYWWLPVWIHLIDTYTSSQLIYEWLPENAIRILKHDFNFDNDEDLKDLIGWLALTHDLGKISPGFYSREKVIRTTKNLYFRMSHFQDEYGQSFNFKFSNEFYSKPRHEAMTAYILEDLLLNKDKRIKRFSKNLKKLLSVSAGHHGSPAQKEYNEAKNLKYNLGISKYAIWENIQKDLYLFVNNKIFKNNEGESIVLKVIKDNITARSIVLLTSIIIMSDWVASNKENFPLLPFEEIVDLEDDYFFDHRTNFYNNYEELDINKKFVSTINFMNNRVFMKNRFGFEPNSLQDTVLNMLNNNLQNNGADSLRECYIIEAPMGLGKTEAALIAAEFINAHTQQSGIFFGLPTMATSNALYDRLGQYLKSYGEEYPDSRYSEILIHSKSFQQETQHAKLTKEYDNDFGITPPNWFSTNKNLKLLNNFVVGTVDQFLSMSLKLKYEYWKHLGMVSKTIIIDEVHSLDGFMLGFLKKSLEWAGYYEVPVIITTATLDSEMKKSLLESYKKGKESIK